MQPQDFVALIESELKKKKDISEYAPELFKGYKYLNYLSLLNLFVLCFFLSFLFSCLFGTIQPLFLWKLNPLL